MTRNERPDGRPAGRPSHFPRPIAEHPGFLLGAGLLSLLPDILLFLRGIPSVHAGRNFLLAVLLALFRSYLLALPLLLPEGGGIPRSGSANGSTRPSF